jgi:hypothetical protein
MLTANVGSDQTEIMTQKIDQGSARLDGCRQL